MPVRFYLEKRLNKCGEAPIRIVWSFGGDRFQSTLGFSIPPAAWDAEQGSVTPAQYNHKMTPTSAINGYLDAVRRAVNRVENHAAISGAALTKGIVKRVMEDVLSAGGNYPVGKEPSWFRLIRERGQSRERTFVHFKGGRYRLVGIGKDSETLREVVIYQALYGDNEIWVRPYDMFFGKVTLPGGVEVPRFREE